MRRWRASIGFRLAAGLLLMGAVALGGAGATVLPCSTNPLAMPN